MKNFRPYFVALGLAAATLSSCGRSYYSFQSKAPAYSNSASAAQEPANSAITSPAATASATVVAAALPTNSVADAAPERQAAPTTRAAVTPAPAVATSVATIAPTPTKVAKPSAVQRLALRSVWKQAAKAAARQQNTAAVTHTAATKGSLTIGIIGLIALVVGIIVSSSFLITVGIIVAVVGIILFLLKLL